MELSQLVFDVQTQKLLDARKAIDDLTKSMGQFNRVSADDAKSAIASAKAREADAKAAISLAKAKEIETKAALAAAKINESNVKVKLSEEAANRRVVAELEKKAAAEEKATQAAIKSAQAASNSVSVLERQQSILEFMTQGFSKGQASILATAQAAGALTEELSQLGSVMQIQRKLSGNDPFDKSMSGLVALKNQYGEIREAIRQYNADSDLTRNQTRELTRDKERIIEKMKQEKSSFTDIKNAIKDYNAVYTDQASKVNKLLGVEKERERSQRDHINAIRNVQSAEERLFSTISHINEGLSNNANLNERAALAVGSYERNLRLAGISGEQAAVKLKKFKDAQAVITASENKRMGDYIARGVGVQLGDVGVSLASGQNPFIVMIQQGDQLRGLIQQAGRDGIDLKNVMNDAAGQIAKSFKDVGIAVSSFVGGAVVQAGKSLKDGFIAPFTLVGELVKNIFSKQDINLGPQIDGNTLAIRNFTTALKGSATALLSIAVVIGGVFAKAMYDANKQTDEVVKQFALSGNSLGLSASSISKVRDELSSMNITMTVSSSILSEMSKASNLTASEISMVAKSASEMEKLAGVAIEDTVKSFSKMKKEPVEALLELSNKTGLVSAETFKSVVALKEQGNQAGASSLAITELARVNSEQIDRMKADYSSFTLAIKDMGTGISSFFDTVFKSMFDRYDFNVEAKKIANKTIAELSKIEDIRSRSGLGLSKDEQSRLDAARSAIEMYSTEEKAAKTARDARQKQIDIENEGIKARSDLASAAASGMSKEQKYRKDALSLGDTYRKSIIAAVGDQEKLNKAVSDYNLALKGLQETRDKPSGSDNKAAAEAKRLKELADYYNLQATQNADYSPDYLKKKADLEKLFKTKAITAPAFAIGTTELEKSQPWYKDYQKEVEAAKNIQIATDDLNRSYEQQQKLQLMQIKAKLDNIGLTEEEKLVKEQLVRVEEDRVKNLEKINDLVAKASKYMTSENLDNYRNELKTQEQIAYEERKATIEQSTKDVYAQVTSFESGWKNAFASYTDMAKNSADLGKKAFESMTNGLADALTEFVMTGKLSLTDFANHFIKEMIRAQMQSMAAQATNATAGILKTVIGTALGAWAGGGASTATTGPSAATGVGGTSWLGSGQSLNTGYADGGYTGYGNVNQPAGVVHKGEVVWSQEDIARAGGVGTVEAMRQGLRGYADGGLVGNRFNNPQQAANDSSSVSVSVTINSDGTTDTETNPDQSGKQLGNLIANAVQAELVKQKRNGGLLASR